MHVNNILKFLKDRRGNYGMLMAIAAAPLLLAANFSIDYVNASRVRVELQALADSVALAAVRKMPDEDAAKQAANEVYTAGMAEFSAGLIFADLTMNFALDPEYLAHSVIKGQIKSSTGFSFTLEPEFKVEAKAIIPDAYMDIAVTTDMSNSMNQGGKIVALRSSLENFIDTVMGLKSEAIEISVGIAPFNGSVLLPSYAAEWTDPKFKNASFCAPPRDGAYDMTDMTPDEAKFDSPDKNTVKCPDQELLALTSNKMDLVNKTRSLKPKSGGGTANHIAASWALRMLSPKWEFIWPNGGAKPNSIKIAILMTDGENTKAGGGHNKTFDEELLKVCANMKALNIEVFAVAFKTPNHVKPMLEKCATSTKHVYAPSSNAQLNDAFIDIAQEALARRQIQLIN